MVNVFISATAALVATLLASANAKLETVTLKHPQGSSAEVFLFGAHVKSFHPAMDPKLDILFMSTKSFMDSVKPLCGGIPVVFPNFGSQKGLPNHGFARITNWTLANHKEAQDKKSPSVATFTMASSNSTRAMWPVDFALTYEVKLYANELKTALHVHNTFEKPIEFHALLHNYLWVDNAENKGVTVNGFKGVEYYDKVAKMNKTETREFIDFAAQTDNVYRNAPDLVSATIKGVNAVDRTVTVRKSGSITGGSGPKTKDEGGSGMRHETGGQKRVKTKKDCVLWNPWAERAKVMEDFGELDYKNMVAIEPGRVSEKQVLPAGQTYTLQQTISVYTL